MGRIHSSFLAVALLSAAPAAAQENSYPLDPELVAKVTDADFVAMIAKIDLLVAETSAHFGCATEHLETKPGQRTYVRQEPGPTRGDVVELTTSAVPVSLEDFLASIPAAQWGENLAQHIGGEVKPWGPGRQIERMVLRAMPKHQQMTKIEEIVEERSESGTLQRVTVYWEVIGSGNDTVIRDVGYIRFARGGPQRTLITTHSGHRFGGYPFTSDWVSSEVKEAITAASLKLYFNLHAARYRKLAVNRTHQRKLEHEQKRGLATQLTEVGSE